MATKKLQILDSLIKQAENADTLDGKHADEFAAASDVETLKVQVGDTKVSEQILTAVDSIRAENADTSGKLAKLTMDIDGINAEVSRKEADMEIMLETVTSVKQSAEQVKITVEQMQHEGVSKVKTQKDYTFDENGLRISGNSGMENLLDETGMHVRRSGQELLEATHKGVTITDVSVRNYLVIGKHARFEDYSNDTDSRRTACFSLELEG